MARETYILLGLLLTLVVSSPLPESPGDDDYRLRRTVIPTSYDLTIIPHYVEDRIVNIKSYEGNVRIQASVGSGESPMEIELHSAPNINIKEVKLIEEGKDIIEPEYSRNNITEKLTISMESKIENNVTIIISFNSDFEDGRLTGFYYSTYKYESTKDGALLATKFEPTHARKAYPCFDEPGLKAKFDLRIKVTDLTDARANTEERTSVRDVDNWLTFETSPIMTTYLLAFIVYEKESFGSSEPSGELTNHRTWARLEAINANQSDLSQKDGPPMIKFMENYTNIKYDTYISKMDQVALPDFQSGAMENWGLVTYRETSLLFDQNTGTTAMHKRVSDVIAHELVHQWFGNLVVTDWWDSVWLNEGFANYFELLIMEDLYPKWRMLERFVVDEQMSVFALDATADSVPLTKPDVLSPEAIGNHFGSISYSKGGAILRQISNVLGENNFKEACKEYLTTHAESSAIAEELLDIFKEHNDESTSGLNKNQLKSALHTWTLQQGFPVVTAERLNSTHFRLSQKRFLQTPETLEDIDEMPLYYVPLTWTKEGEDVEKRVREPQAWLTDKQSSIIISITNLTENQWVLFNSWQSGYYRVNYDVGSWNKISVALQKDVNIIAAVDRAAIVDNLVNLARAGEVTYQLAIDGIGFLRDDLDFLPWASARAALAHMDRMMGRDPAYKSYIQSLVGKAYDKMSWENNYEEQDNVQLTHRINVFTIACAAGHSDCLQNSEKMLHDIDKVHKELQSVVYCYGLKAADQAQWDALWGQWEEANNNAARRGLLTTALGCANDQKILKQYLEKSLNSSVVRPQDAYTVFTAVYTNPDGVNVALDFLQDKGYETLENAYGQVRNVMNTIISGLASRLTEKSQRKQLEDAIGEDRITKHATALRTLESNILWMEHFKQDVLSALNNGAPTASLAACVALLCATVLAVLR